MEGVRDVSWCGLCLVHCWVLRQQDLQRFVAGPVRGAAFGWCFWGFWFPVFADRMRGCPLWGGGVWGVGVGVVV